MKIELIHPVIHDGMEYERGVHDMDEATALHFIRTAPQAAHPWKDAATQPGRRMPAADAKKNDK